MKKRAFRTFVSHGESPDVPDQDLKGKARRSALLTIFDDLVSDYSWLEPEKQVPPVPEEKPSAEDTLTIPPDMPKQTPPAPAPEAADKVPPQPVPSMDETIVLPSSPKKATPSRETPEREEDAKDLSPDKFMETMKQKEKKDILLDETIVIPRKPRREKDS